MDRLSKENTQNFQDGYDRSIMCIENLCNELIYGIFDYLDGSEILQGFFNLNSRFQELLRSSSLLFKFHFHETNDKQLIDEYKQIIMDYKHQIISFDLWLSARNNYFFSTFSIDSSFDHLESLSLVNIDSNVLKLLHSTLPNVPRLFSFSIGTNDRLINDVYRLIFDLPKLKYVKCSSDDCNIPVRLPMATDERFNPIESLILDHPCTYEELFAILSYTSELRHLKFQHVDMDDSMMGLMMPSTLSNLTHISMYVHYMRFDELEVFLSHLDCDLKVLRMTTLCGDANYFDDDRWEEFIVDYMPQLEEFYFQYHDELDHESDYRTYFNKRDRFTSQFWIEKKWALEVKMNSVEIIYFIRPYRKRWYDIDSSTDLSQPTRLILTHIPDNNDRLMFRINMRDLLAVTKIYHFEIPKKEIYFGELINLLHVLPDLISLKIHSLALSLPPYSAEEKESLRFVSKKNQMTKISLEKINHIRESEFFIQLCPRLNYLQLNVVDYVTMESYIRDIINRINQEHHRSLRSLGISVPLADDQMIEQLGQIFPHHSIKRRSDHIYLQWK